MFKSFFAMCFSLLLLFCNNVFANPVLTVDVYMGKDRSESIGYSGTELKELMTHDLSTQTPWTKGLQSFKGPRLKHFVNKHKPDAKKIVAYAIDGYHISIPVEDVKDHDVILAMEKNGRVMRIRDRGPLWVIYPWSDKPELRKETVYARAIWQVARIELH